VRDSLTREGIEALMRALARESPARGKYRVFLVGGGTAVWAGWREATIDADLFSDTSQVFRNIQEIKERLRIHIEFARPEDFVPPLAGTDRRHVFIRTIGRVDFFHYDPYAQLLSKVVRGFRRDMLDADRFVESGWVEAGRFRSLVEQIPDSAYAKYPALSKAAVLRAVNDFLRGFRA
jgi:hypothetical protein